MEEINWNSVAAISSSAAAIAALIFSIVSFKSQQKRAEKFASANIRPLLILRSQTYSHTKSILLINQGLGPAIITKAEFSKGAKKTDSIVELFDLPIGTWESYINVPIGTVIRPQDQRVLVLQTKQHLIDINKTSPKDADKILALWQQQKTGIEVLIEFNNVLDQEQDAVDEALN